MNFAAEVNDFLSSAKKGRDLVWDPEKKYQEEYWKYVKHENDDYDARKKARDQAAAGGKPVSDAQQATSAPQALVTTASSSTPVVGPTALNTSAPAMPRPAAPAPQYDTSGGFLRRGGKVGRRPTGHYAGGGVVGIAGVDDEPIGSDGQENWARIQQMMASSPRQQQDEGSSGRSQSGKDMAGLLKAMINKNKGGTGGTPPFNPDAGTGETYAQGGMVERGGGGLAFCPHCHHYIGHRNG